MRVRPERCAVGPARQQREIWSSTAFVFSMQTGRRSKCTAFRSGKTYKHMSGTGLSVSIVTAARYASIELTSGSSPLVQVLALQGEPCTMRRTITKKWDPALGLAVEEYGLSPPQRSPALGALSTFGAFILCRTVPLLTIWL